MALALLALSLAVAQRFQRAIASEGGAFAKDVSELTETALAAAVQWRRAPVVENKLVHVHYESARVLCVGYE
jgi:hypothetical protein